MRASSYRKSEVSQEKVLDAAIGLVAERGLAATTVKDIADAAGLSKGSIHYHFKDKDDMLVHVLERCCRRAEERIRGAFDQPGMPMERVRRAVLEMWAIRREKAPEFQVLTELHALARQNAPLREAMVAAYRRAREHIVEDGFKRLIEMGLRPKIPLSVAPRLLLATLDGLALQNMIEPFGPEEEADILRALELSSIAMFEI